MKGVQQLSLLFGNNTAAFVILIEMLTVEQCEIGDVQPITMSSIIKINKVGD